MNMQSDLARVRGLGASRDGTAHWWAQRVTAVALVPLSLWFAYSAVTLVGIDQAGFKIWLNGAGNLLMIILFVVVLFYHMQLGVQIVLEDYVHGAKAKIFWLISNKLVAVFFGVSSIIAVLKVAFGG